MKFRVAILAVAFMFLFGCSSMRLRYSADIETKDGKSGHYSFAKTYPVKTSDRTLCIITGIFYGGWCWVYLGLPRQEQATAAKDDALEQLKKEIGEGYTVNSSEVRRIAFNDESSPNYAVKFEGEEEKSRTFADNTKCTRLQGDDMDETVMVYTTTDGDCECKDVSRTAVAQPAIAINKANKGRTYRVYVTYRGSEWSFIQSFVYKINGRLSPRKEVDRIDSKVAHVSEWGATVVEEVVLDIPKNDFIYFTTHDMKLRVHGKRGDGDFLIPSSLFKEVFDRAKRL